MIQTKCKLLLRKSLQSSQASLKPNFLVDRVPLDCYIAPFLCLPQLSLEFLPHLPPLNTCLFCPLYSCQSFYPSRITIFLYFDSSSNCLYGLISLGLIVSIDNFFITVEWHSNVVTPSAHSSFSGHLFLMMLTITCQFSDKLFCHISIKKLLEWMLH